MHFARRITERSILGRLMLVIEALALVLSTLAVAPPGNFTASLPAPADVANAETEEAPAEEESCSEFEVLAPAGRGTQRVRNQSRRLFAARLQPVATSRGPQFQATGTPRLTSDRSQLNGCGALLRC